MKKTKPKTLKLTPKSPRLVRRMALILAYESLPWVDQQSWLTKARDLVERLKEVEP